MAGAVSFVEMWARTAMRKWTLLWREGTMAGGHERALSAMTPSCARTLTSVSALSRHNPLTYVHDWGVRLTDSGVLSLQTMYSLYLHTATMLGSQWLGDMFTEDVNYPTWMASTCSETSWQGKSPKNNNKTSLKNLKNQKKNLLSTTTLNLPYLITEKSENVLPLHIVSFKAVLNPLFSLSIHWYSALKYWDTINIHLIHTLITYFVVRC